MFTFKSFTIHQDRCAMKVGTDGVLLGAWAQGGSRILDIGTGTGIIAMMMAQRFPDADITAIDIDAEACKQAAENFNPTAGIILNNSILSTTALSPTLHSSLTASGIPMQDARLPAIQTVSRLPSCSEVSAGY